MTASIENQNQITEPLQPVTGPVAVNPELPYQLPYGSGEPLAPGHEGPLAEVDAAIEDQSERDNQLDADKIRARIQAPEAPSPNILSKAIWHAELERAVDQAHADGSPFSAAFIDLNAFKEVNDKLGHARGDQVIKEMGTLLSSVFRTSDAGKQGVEAERIDNKTDLIMREQIAPLEDNVSGNTGHIGGDEYGIAVRGGADVMDIIVTRARKAFAGYIDLPENADLRGLGSPQSGGFGLAIGTATLELGETASSLLSRADAAMYLDKVSQSPELLRRQKIGVNLSRFILKKVGLRLRDLPKIEALEEYAKTAKVKLADTEQPGV